MINARLLTRSLCNASQCTCIHTKLPQPHEASERLLNVAAASTMHAARWSALTALGAVGGSCGQMCEYDAMIHDVYDCIIIICPHSINTGRVAVCGGHGRLQTKRDYVLNIHEPYTHRTRAYPTRGGRGPAWRLRAADFLL